MRKTINSNSEDKETKTTSEKPVSLNPLKFKEALLNLLAVKPKPEEEGESKEEESKAPDSG